MIPTSQNYSAAVRGMNSDSNDLVSPEETTLDESNYELLRDGTRRRRRAIIEEHLRPGHRGVNANTAHTCYLWRTPAKMENRSFLVEQRNNLIEIFDQPHENPRFMREAELFSLDLGLYGTAHIDEVVDLEHPCTYTEGNGALYIFHPTTGTIKVELLPDGIRATPIGTWIRDYEGAAETINTDARMELEQPLSEYSPGQPFLASGRQVLTTEGSNPVDLPLTSEIPLPRYYNYSNTGWDERGLAEFITQSMEPYEILSPFAKDGRITKNRGSDPIIPALSDRYLAGRQVDEDGQETFAFNQLIEARQNRASPPMGARIKHSALHPAGTLVGQPSNMLENIQTVVFTNGSYFISVNMDTPQVHSIGVPADSLALFVHYMTFTVEDADGRVWEGGFSGVLDAQLQSASTSDTVVFSEYNNQYLVDNGFTNFTVTGLYGHPGPQYFPHQVRDNDARYDFRAGRRPSTGAFFAGRLWQSGDVHSRLYFGQQLEAGTNVARDRGVARESLCYAAADPTDGFDSALVATDGGYINISDTGTHYGLVVLGPSLYLLTDNGIWAISPGGDNGVFLANNFRVDQISRAEVLGFRSWVIVENELHVATDEGIIAIGREGERSLTDFRIRFLYDDFVIEGREVIGAYDPETDVVRWVLSENFGVVDVQSTLPTIMLNYHRLLDSWFRYDLPSAYTIADICVIPFTAVIETYNRFRYLVVAKNFDLFAQIGAPLSSDYGVEANIGPLGYDEWVEFHDPENKFRDFHNSTSEPSLRESMPAFLLTNHIFLGEGGRFSQINYLVTNQRNVTTDWVELPDGTNRPNCEGSTMVQGRFDWFDNERQGKYSPPQETYRFRRSYLGSQTDYDRGEPTIVSKVKIRGRGREFRLFYEATGNTDSWINGWTIYGLVKESV